MLRSGPLGDWCRGLTLTNGTSGAGAGPGRDRDKRTLLMSGVKAALVPIGAALLVVSLGQLAVVLGAKEAVTTVAWYAAIGLALIIAGILLVRPLRVATSRAPAASTTEPQLDEPQEEGGRSTRNALSALGVVAVLTALLLATLLGVLSYFETHGGTAEVVLTPVILVAVVVLVLALGALAVVFHRLRLQNANAAMGMPEGSIRAVIALMLIILFFVLSVFLFGQLQRSGGSSSTIEGLTAAEVSQIPVDQLLAKTQTGSAEAPTFTVVRRVSVDPDLQNYALQLLTTISTLVVAVASFYFGSNSVTSAIAKIGNPDKTGITNPDKAEDGPGGQKTDGKDAPPART